MTAKNNKHRVTVSKKWVTIKRHPFGPNWDYDCDMSVMSPEQWIRHMNEKVWFRDQPPLARAFEAAIAKWVATYAKRPPDDGTYIQ